MSDKIKSAYELAMERLSKKDPAMRSQPLTADQKDRIQEIRREYQAKIAERKIMLKSRLAELSIGGDPQEVLQRKQDLEMTTQDAIEILNREMERQISEVRGDK